MASVAEVRELEVDHGQPGGLVRVDAEGGRGPVRLLVLALVLGHLVLELALVSVLKVVPGHQRDRLLLVAPLVLGGDGVLAVEDDGLVRLLGEQLHEAHLVLVRLVVEDVLGGPALAQPHRLGGLVLHGHLQRDLRLAGDAGGLGVGVAVDEDGVPGIRSVRVNPVLAARLLGVSYKQVSARLGRSVLVSIWGLELSKRVLQLFVCRYHQ